MPDISSPLGISTLRASTRGFANIASFKEAMRVVIFALSSPLNPAPKIPSITQTEPFRASLIQLAIFSSISPAFMTFNPALFAIFS